jgi:surface polysaccharide O-acyltransferase-like enzyme
MASGYLLLTKDYLLSDFYRQRFSRILPPWLFWGSLAWLISGSALSSIKAVYLNGFWFMPVIAGIYLLAPLLKAGWIKLNRRQQLLTICLWLSLMLAVLAAKQAKYITHDHTFKFFILAFSGYFLAGGFLAQTNRRTLRKYLWPLALVFMTSYIFTLAITFWQTGLNRGYSSLWVLDVSPNMILMAGSAFILVKLVGDKVKPQLPRLLRRIITSLSKATLGIFLSHVVLLGIMAKLVRVFDLPTPMVHPLLYIPLVSLVVLILAWQLVLLMNRIPILKWGSGVA